MTMNVILAMLMQMYVNMIMNMIVQNVNDCDYVYVCENVYDNE